MSTIAISVIDDHTLVRNGIAQLIKTFDETTIIGLYGNGVEFIKSLEAGNIPDIVILDIDMPVMNGVETALWITKHQPSIGILALSMYHDDIHILRMIRSGARGYIPKDVSLEELRQAIQDIYTRKIYHSELVSGAMMKSMAPDADQELLNLAEKEIEFLQLCCSELTYKEIGIKMQISVRTVDGYRDRLLEKFGLKSRVGLVLFSLKNGIAKI